MPNTVSPENQKEIDPALDTSSATTAATYIGRTIKEVRLRFELTLEVLAKRAGISRGMLSKIENAQTMPGLDTLFKIADALGISMSSLFATFDAREQGAQHFKHGEAPEILRTGSTFGYNYFLLARNPEAHKNYEPFIITVDDKAEPFPFFEHPGTEIVHVMAGRMEYRHGQNTYTLEPGDTLTYDSDIPHGPERILETPIRVMCVMIHPD